MIYDPFYLIVDSADWIERLVPRGVKLVQLRIKQGTDEQIRDHIRRAKQICADYQCQLIINDYWQLAIEEGCDFIHLGQEDLAVADLTTIRKSGLKLGISTHDHDELAIALAAKPDYVALGPIYPTILKKMKWAPQGLERIAIWKQQIAPLPLVAIGGLTIERAIAALEKGADCCAVVTDILLHETPEKRVDEWLDATAPWRRQS